MTFPLLTEILAEWTMADPGSDLVRWHDGLSLYESGNLVGQDAADEAAEMMCAGLTHFLAGEPLPEGWAGEPSETAVARTIWDVLTTTLQGGTAGVGAGWGRRLRLALAAMRQCGYQAQDLGGNGFMAGFFDTGSRQLMTLALASGPGMSGTARPVDLAGWFSSAERSAPVPIMPSVTMAPVQGVGATGPPPGDTGGATAARRTAAATWNSVKNTARQAQQHVNPVLLQHGIDAVQDALIESKVAKIDKRTGKLKVRKLGVAKAAIRPGQTARQAIEGAAIGERLRSYDETAHALPFACTPEEFGSYPSKRDYLRDWARRLIVAADVTPTGPLIDAYANAAAHSICSQVFMPLSAARGISQCVHPDSVSAGTAQETFDALYLKAAPTQAEQQRVNEQITAFLNASRDEWAQRIRQQYS